MALVFATVSFNGVNLTLSLGAFSSLNSAIPAIAAVEPLLAALEKSGATVVVAGESGESGGFNWVFETGVWVMA